MPTQCRERFYRWKIGNLEELDHIRNGHGGARRDRCSHYANTRIEDPVDMLKVEFFVGDAIAKACLAAKLNIKALT